MAQIQIICTYMVSSMHTSGPKSSSVIGRIKFRIPSRSLNSNGLQLLIAGIVVLPHKQIIKINIWKPQMLIYYFGSADERKGTATVGLVLLDILKFFLGWNLLHNKLNAVFSLQSIWMLSNDAGMSYVLN